MMFLRWLWHETFSFHDWEVAGFRWHTTDRVSYREVRLRCTCGTERHVIEPPFPSPQKGGLLG